MKTKTVKITFGKTGISKEVSPEFAKKILDLQKWIKEKRKLQEINEPFDSNG